MVLALLFVLITPILAIISYFAGIDSLFYLFSVTSITAWLFEFCIVKEGNGVDLVCLVFSTIGIVGLTFLLTDYTFFLKPLFLGISYSACLGLFFGLKNFKIHH